MAKAAASKAAKPGKSASPKEPFTRDRGVLLSAKEAALYLGVTEGLMSTLALRGDLPRVRVGPQLTRFHINDLDEFIVAQRETAGGR